jgi:hypothetical protein
MSIQWNSNVTYPVSLYGLIPSGSAFSLPISQTPGTDTYDFTVDIASGTQFLLFMSDNGPYQTGGSTSLLTVNSGNTNCMNSSSPSSATSSASARASSTSASTSSSINSSSSSSSSPSSSASNIAGVGGSSVGGATTGGGKSSSSSHTGAIVGGAVGGVAFLVLLALLLFCCVRRRARSKEGGADPAIKSYGVASGGEKAGRGRRGPMDLLATRGRVASDEGEGPASGRAVGGEVYEPSPFRYPSPPQTPNANHGLGLGAGTGAGAGVGAALAGAGLAGAMSEKTTTPGRTRHSTNSDNAPSPLLTSTANTTPPSGTGISNSSAPPTTYSGAGATDGHASSPRRGDSIRKAPSLQQMNVQSIPSSPGLGGGIRESGEGGRPLPEVPTRGDVTRFVQHEDSGQVV